MNYGDPRLPPRFWDKVIPVPESGCWLWLGTAPSGSPQIRWKVGAEHKTVSAKRLAFEHAYGPQEAEAIGGCGDRCVHPDHQIAGTPTEVTAFYNATFPRVLCPAGHVLAEVGIYVCQQNGYPIRHCRACHVRCIERHLMKLRRRRVSRMKPARRALFVKMREKTIDGHRRSHGPSLRERFAPELAL